MDKQYDPNVTPKKQVFSAQIDLKKFEKATDEEKKQQDVMSESTTFFRDGMRKLMKNPLAVLSLDPPRHHPHHHYCRADDRPL